VSELATRAIIFYLKSPFGGDKSAQAIRTSLCSNDEPSQVLAITQINRIYQKLCKNGFNPDGRAFYFKDEWIEDEKRSGRLTKQTDEVKAAIEKLVITNRSTQKKTCTDIAWLISTELGMKLSASTV
jgi:hypothetical protein